MNLKIKNFLENKNDDFYYKEGIIGGESMILIYPKNNSIKWSNELLEFRSLIVNPTTYEICSRSFPKFFNYSEHPEIDPFPQNEEFSAYTKHDGSLLIWGIHNNEIIHRTRGTFNAEALGNGHEVAFLKKKYPLLQVAIQLNPEYSILTEWETPNNVICIRDTNEPKLTLIGVIHNATGKLESQESLNLLAEAWGLSRPEVHQYNSIQECIADVTLWTGKEGVCVYSKNGQKIRKIKGEWYCALHKIMTGFKTTKHVLELFMETPRHTSASDFYQHVVDTVDYEVAESIKHDIDKVVEAYKSYLAKLAKVQQLVDLISSYESRREQALDIQTHYKDWRAGAAFSLLDKKPISDKLIFEVLKKELGI